MFPYYQRYLLLLFFIPYNSYFRDQEKENNVFSLFFITNRIDTTLSQVKYVILKVLPGHLILSHVNSSVVSVVSKVHPL